MKPIYYTDDEFRALLKDGVPPIPNRVAAMLPNGRCVVTTYEGGVPVNRQAVWYTVSKKGRARTIVLTEKGRAYLKALREAS